MIMNLNRMCYSSASVLQKFGKKYYLIFGLMSSLLYFQDVSISAAKRLNKQEFLLLEVAC